MPKAACLIVNPAAGGGKGARLAAPAESELRRLDIAVRRVDTRDLDHGRALALEAARRGETIVALGGDGLLGALADAVRVLPGAVLGLIPGGRGNDLARVLGISEDPAEAAAVVATGQERSVDLGLVVLDSAEGGGRAFVGIASAGFDSDANRIANEAPSWLGGLVYVYGALRALAAWKPARIELTLEPSGERHAFSSFSVAAANSSTYGGGMRAAPDAMLDDGMLDVVLLESVSKRVFLTRVMPKSFKGTHVHEPGVHVYRTPEVVLSADRPFTMYADGDPIAELPVRVRALPGAVTMLTPSQPGTAFAR